MNVLVFYFVNFNKSMCKIYNEIFAKSIGVDFSSDTDFKADRCLIIAGRTIFLVRVSSLPAKWNTRIELEGDY